MTPGHEALVIPVSHALAITGLALWSWPLAALIITSQLRRTDPDIYEALRLVPAPRWRYWLAVASMTRAGLIAAFGAVFLVMLGSAVPLHVAQLDTYAIKLWRTLDETPHAEHWRVWLASWPLLLTAVAAALIAATRLRTETTESARTGQPVEPRPRLTPALAAAAAIWSLAVLAPVLLFILNLRSLHSLATFWRVTWRPILSSAAIAAACAAAAALIASSTWIALAGTPAARRLARLSIIFFLIAGLSPGILVGLAIAEAWTATDFLSRIADSPAILILAHTARFGFVAALAGWWLARTEPRELRDLRRLDAGDSLRGWLLASIPSQAGILAGASLAVGLLSFHEIEAAVMLQPPSSSGGGFAWLMLQQLHFARTQELAAGMVYIIGGGLTLALVAAWLLGRGPKAAGLRGIPRAGP
jgi:ABC-type Fe3+ transport system permease subunit